MKDIFDQTVATYRSEEGAAAWVAKERKFEVERNARVYSVLGDLDVRGMRVLDVGCGYGRDVAEFRRRGAEAFGCDVSAPLLAQAVRDVGPYFKILNLCGVKSVPFGGDFDLIWCCAVLVHIPRSEISPLLQRMWEGLKAGGRLVIVTKHGMGEEISCNLGENLPRVMMFYEIDDILKILKPLGAVVELADAGHSATAFGETLLAVRVRKPL